MAIPRRRLLGQFATLVDSSRASSVSKAALRAYLNGSGNVRNIGIADRLFDAFAQLLEFFV
jgi:hypothetical protein